MREARIILPNDILTEDHNVVALDKLTASFGGWTAHPGTGTWLNPKDGKEHIESVIIVDVAYEPNTERDHALFKIAQSYAQDAKQECVYLRYGNGYVQLVAQNDIMDNGNVSEFYSPDFAGMPDAMQVLIGDNQTPGSRLNALQYLVRGMVKGNPGHHKQAVSL